MNGHVRSRHGSNNDLLSLLPYFRRPATAPYCTTQHAVRGAGTRRWGSFSDTRDRGPYFVVGPARSARKGGISLTSSLAVYDADFFSVRLGSVIA